MRATQFIHYINLKYEPIPMAKITDYSHLVFWGDVQGARKKYRKNLKGKRIAKKGSNENR